MAINIQYNRLGEKDGSIRLEIKGTADFIVARKVGDSKTVQVLDAVVAPANQQQGHGRELVETLLKECVSRGITKVEIKQNDNPLWWLKAKSFTNGKLIST